MCKFRNKEREKRDEGEFRSELQHNFETLEITFKLLPLYKWIFKRREEFLIRWIKINGIWHVARFWIIFETFSLFWLEIRFSCEFCERRKKGMEIIFRNPLSLSLSLDGNSLYQVRTNLVPWDFEGHHKSRHVFSTEAEEKIKLNNKNLKFWTTNDPVNGEQLGQRAKHERAKRYLELHRVMQG